MIFETIKYTVFPEMVMYVAVDCKSDSRQGKA